MYCVKCGTQLPESAAFCFKCGAATAATQSAPQTALAPPPTWQTMELELREGGMAGKATLVNTLLGGGTVTRCMVIANVNGPDGPEREEMAEFPLQTTYPLELLTGFDRQSGERVLDEIRRRLLSAGWEELPRGHAWYSHRYRRHVGGTSKVATPEKTYSKVMDVGERIAFVREKGITECEIAVSLERNDEDSNYFIIIGRESNSRWHRLYQLPMPPGEGGKKNRATEKIVNQLTWILQEDRRWKNTGRGKEWYSFRFKLRQ